MFVLQQARAQLILQHVRPHFTACPPSFYNTRALSFQHVLPQSSFYPMENESADDL
jgi:hypothetical protein